MRLSMTVRAAILAFACTASVAAYAMADTPKVVNVQAGELTDALETLAKQCGVDVIYPSSQLRGLRTQGVSGTLEVKEAFRKLIEGTPLTLKEEGGAVLITLPRGGSSTTSEPTTPPRAVDSESEPKKSFWSRFRLAQSDPPSPSEGGHPGEVTAAEARKSFWSRLRIAQFDTPSSEPAQSAERELSSTNAREVLEEIVVTGTHIRGAAPAAPQIVISRSDIDKTGYTSIQQVMESLPQNFAEISQGGRFATEGGSTLATSNNDRTAGIDLRGLGAQSTLTLLNGARWAGSVGGRVFDISAVPLSMIERIDVVTGAHSAIYGADAVGGVVNLVTRRDFDGIETQATYGGTRGGGERMQIGQLGGAKFARGGVAIGYEYSREWPLDLADVDLLTLQPSPDNSDVTQLHLQAQANTWRHSAFLSGHYDVSDDVQLFADGLYTYKRFEDIDRTLRPGAQNESFTTNQHPARQYGGSIGAKVDLRNEWAATFNAGSSATNTESHSFTFTDFGGNSTQEVNQRKADRATVSYVSAVADGPIVRIAGRSIRTALGIEARREKFDSQVATDGLIAGIPSEDHRSIRSAFSEMLIPLARSDHSGLRSLDLSLAARYDDYSDFGHTFNPQYGLTWEPLSGLRFHGGYSKAFRAPALAELSSQNTAFLIPVVDPAAATGTSPALIYIGDNPDLGPERARNWNFGVELAPAWLPSTTVSLSFFDVRYQDRIESPASGFTDQLEALTNANRYADLIDRTPQASDLAPIIAHSNESQGFINFSGIPFGPCDAIALCNPTAEELLAAFPSLVLFDDRTNNIAIDKVRGLDLLFRSSHTIAFGALEYGLNATYTLDHRRFVTATSPAFDLINEAGKPVDFRMRVNFGLNAGAVGVFAFLNYVDDYTNPFSDPPEHVSSWTTVDMTLRFDSSSLNTQGAQDRFRATLGIENVFDRDPPIFHSTISGLLYDSMNANPFGRYVSLRLEKLW